MQRRKQNDIKKATPSGVAFSFLSLLSEGYGYVFVADGVNGEGVAEGVVLVVGDGSKKTFW